jgi:NAD+ diphosphatase
MVGFTATAKDTTFRLDEDEIVEAIWVSREELARGVEDGRIGISPRLSIARRLIEHWYGAEIEQPVEWTAPNRPTEQKG